MLRPYFDACGISPSLRAPMADGLYAGGCAHAAPRGERVSTASSSRATVPMRALAYLRRRNIQNTTRYEHGSRVLKGLMLDRCLKV
jgi:hypothetical protein